MFYELAFRTRKAGFQLICLPSLYLYKNTTSLSPLDVKSHIGTPFIHLTEIDSTNRYARNQIDANLTTGGTAYFADHQTEGKGRQERSWVSEPGKNILLSIVLNTNGRMNEEAAALNRLVALACFDLFNDFSGGGTLIKWPNDLYWGDRKAGGILIENIWRGAQWTWSIIGIGLNINQTGFPEQAARATSLRQITGKSYDVLLLAQELCQRLEKRLQQWTSAEEMSTLSEYNNHLYKKSGPVNLLADGKKIAGTSLEVTAAGELQVHNAAGEVITLRQAQWID